MKATLLLEEYISKNEEENNNWQSKEYTHELQTVFTDIECNRILVVIFYNLEI